MRLPGFALRHRAVFLAATALAMVWGGVSFLHMPRREDPEFVVRTCQITTTWPGATAEDMELLVTDPLEQVVSEIDEVKEIASTSLAGTSILRVKLEDSAASDSVDNVWDKVRAKVALAELPTRSGCGTPQVNSDFGDTAAMVLAIYEKPSGTARRFE